MPSPMIEFDDFGHARIRIGDHVVAELTDGAQSSIATIWKHMLDEHGEQDARIYLTGVCHGMREGVAVQIRKALERSRLAREEGRSLISGP